MRIHLSAAGMLIVTVAGCAGSASSDGLAEACASTSNLSEEVCNCLGEKAGEQLTADGRAWLRAALDDDQKAAAELRAKLPASEAMAAGLFMTQAPGECAAELNGP